MDFLREMIRKLLANPMSMFVYSILAKWYIMMYVGAIVVTYWVFSGLNDAGVLSAAYNIVSEVVDSSKSIAKNCTRQIDKPRSFWQCVKNPPAYGVPDEEEINLLKELNSDYDKVFKRNNLDRHNPYEGQDSPSGAPEQEHSSPSTSSGDNEIKQPGEEE